MGKDSTIGIFWNKNVKFKFIDWEKFFEYNLGKLNPGEIKKTEPITIAINTFSQVNHFREFALKKTVNRTDIIESLELSINNGNPFVGVTFPISVIEHKKQKINRNILISSKNNSFKNRKSNFKDNKLSFVVEYERKNNIDIIEMDVQSDIIEFNRDKIIFPVQNNEIIFDNLKKDSYKTYKVDNGIISFETAPDYAPILFSLKFNNNEWLDTSFPDFTSKSWWNPWAGGIYTLPHKLRLKTILKEESMGEFIKVEDIFRNNWEGIKITTHIKENEKYKDLTFYQYFLTLPGVPIMVNTIEIHQKSKIFVNDLNFETMSFIKPENNIQDCSYKFKNFENQYSTIFAGTSMYDIDVKSPIFFSGKNTKEFLLVKTDNKKVEANADVNRQVMSLYLKEKSDKQRFLSTRYYIFSENNIFSTMKNYKFLNIFMKL